MIRLKSNIFIFLSFLNFSCENQYVFVTEEDLYDEDKIDIEDALDKLNEVIDKKEIDISDRIEYPDVKTENIIEAFAPDGCGMPVMDCGANCRQVTCRGYHIYENGFDLYSHYLAYITHDIHWGDLYLVDLDSGEEIMLYGISGEPGEVTMFGNRIIFEQFGISPGIRQLLIYNLDTSNIEEERYGLSEYIRYSCCQKRYDLYEDTLVFVGGREEWFFYSYEIFLFDFTLQEIIQISSTPWDYGASYPRIWDNIIVYTLLENPFPFRIMVYDIQSSVATPLTEEVRANQWNADIWGNRVVWTDFRNGEGTQNSDIYWCDLPDCVPRPATTNFACQDWPSVEGDWIAWVDYRNDPMPLDPENSHNRNTEIWAYNVSMDMEIQVASFNKNLIAPKIHNGKVYFIGPIETQYGQVQEIFEVTLPAF